MRFALLMPGTGHFYCGSCLRDDWLGKALRARGHEVGAESVRAVARARHACSSSRAPTR